jgi:hypothetical protein
MKIILRTVFVVIISFVFMSAAGCAKKQTVKHSGFLENYPTFQPGPEGGIKHVYFREGVDFGSYNKVMLDHVVFYFKDDSKYKGIHADILKDLADAFHEAAVNALEGAYPLVDQPGPDVMRIRVAITDLEQGRPGLTLVTTVMPGGFGVKAIKKATTGTHSFASHTSVEAEMLDSVSGERIAAIMDEGEELEKLKLDISEVKKGMSKWGDVKDVFEFWAQRLRKWLDETHGIKTNDE